MDPEELKKIVSEAIAQALAANSAASASTGRSTTNTERDFVDQQIDSDIGIEEAWSANVKRTYDLHQTSDMDRRGSVLLSEMQHREQINGLLIQQAQNAIETANMLSKQAVKHFSDLDKQHLSHRDVATDHLWNTPDRTATDSISEEIADDAQNSPVK